MSDPGPTQDRTTRTTNTRARNPFLARAVTYGIVIILGAIAVAFTPPLPDRPPAASVLRVGPRAPVWRQRHDTLALGETLGAQKIGIQMSEGFQLWPEQSTSALVCHHPSAKYFTI